MANKVILNEKSNTVNPYERELIRVLEQAMAKKLCSDNLTKHSELYNTLYNAGRLFIEKNVLPGQWSLLQRLNLERADAAVTCATHIFFDKLDYMMSRETPREVIKLIHTMTQNCLKDFWRTEKRYLCGMQAEEGPSLTGEQTSAPPTNLHMDKGWNLIPSADNVEEWAVHSDLALAVLKALKENPNAYEVVSFLETKMVGEKAGALTYEFENMNRNDVCERVLRHTAKLFERIIDADFFRDAAFRDPKMGYNVNVNGNVSHASDRCRNKVLKAIGKDL